MEPERLQQLRTEMAALADATLQDPEVWHSRADDLLIDYIDDDEVRRLYDSIQKWYA